MYLDMRESNIYSEMKGNKVTSILRVYSALNFFVNIILICYSRSHMFELCHVFEGFNTCKLTLWSPTVTICPTCFNNR
jgi:hypothetical protein